MEKNVNNYEKLTVKSQEEFDMIPDVFQGRIYIEFGTFDNPAIVNRTFIHSVVAYDNSYVAAYGDSSVEAYSNSFVLACDHSSVIAYENSFVLACDHSSVLACDHSSVTAYDDSSVETNGNSSVETNGNNFVKANDHSSVTAYGNGSVLACDYSSVTAHGNSSVEAYGNSQIMIDQISDGQIKVYGNARIVCNPKTIEEYMLFYGLKHDNKKGIFYKAVKRYGNGIYHSYHDESFTYSIGEIIKEECDPNVNKECSFGIHMAYLTWALNFGRDWTDLAILEVESDLDKIVIPANGRGKVRTSELRVIREISLEECGVYGKILAKRQKLQNNK